MLNTELNFSNEILNDSYAAATAALMVGGLTLIPFALKFGRRPVYVGSLAVQFGMAIWYARTYTVGDLMGTNIVSCFVGALSEIMVQMTVADVYFVHERGLMNTIYYWVTTVGSILSGIAGGYITDGMGWRWIWWFLAIFLGILTLIFFFTYEETLYLRAQVTIGGEAVHSETTGAAYGNSEKSGLASEKQSPAVEPNLTQTEKRVNIDHGIPTKSYVEKLRPWVIAPGSFIHYLRHTYQCFLVMWYCPAVFYMALLNGAANTAQIIFITVYSTYLYDAPYNLSESAVGLFGLSGFIGVMIASLVIGPLSDRSIVWLSKRNGGIYEPEMRLWLVLLSTPIFLLAVLLFGLGLAHNRPWLVLAFGYAILGFGITPASSLSLTYLTDAYTEVSLPHGTAHGYTLTLDPDHRRLPCGCQLHQIWLRDHFGFCVDAVDRAGRHPKHVRYYRRHLHAHLLGMLRDYQIRQADARQECSEVLRVCR